MKGCGPQHRRWQVRDGTRVSVSQSILRADHYLACARLSDAAFNSHIAVVGSLTSEEKTSIIQFCLLQSYVEQFENTEMKSAMLDLEPSVTDLQNAPLEANRTLKAISDVQRGAAIADEVVGVDFPVFKPTPGSLFGSVRRWFCRREF